jgi:hypothetical protein
VVQKIQDSQIGSYHKNLVVLQDGKMSPKIQENIKTTLSLVCVENLEVYQRLSGAPKIQGIIAQDSNWQNDGIFQETEDRVAHQFEDYNLARLETLQASKGRQGWEEAEGCWGQGQEGQVWWKFNHKTKYYGGSGAGAID